MKPRIVLLTLTFILAAFWAGARNTEQQAQPNKKNDINGSIVHSQSKKPLSKVNVTAYSAVKKEKVVASDSNGNFSFSDLKPGTYRFVFEKNGFKKVTREKVVVHSDEALQLNIKMFETEDFNFIPGTFNFVEF